MSIPVQVSAAALTNIAGCVEDLSLSGALMKADADLRLHSLIEVTIKLPPPSQGAAVVAAHVSRKLEEGVGVEWCQFAPSAVKDWLRSPSVRLPV
ncbi:MAG: PilZ domain-containing protein [Pseudomonadota bacterium]|nr:PilZ domain-containing protein [Pseudomonadota bacterium]